MAIKENTYVYVNISKDGEVENYKRSRCLKIHENGTCDVKIMMKGNSYQKDENGKPIINNINIEKIEENKPGKNTKSKKSTKITKAKSNGKNIIVDETLLEEEKVNYVSDNVSDFWHNRFFEDFLTEEDIEHLGDRAFKLTEAQLERERIKY